MRYLLPAVLAVVLVAGGQAVGDYPLGDFDFDMDVDDEDLDLMGDAIRLDWTDPMYDISADGETEGQDGVIDLLDMGFLIRFLVWTSVGEGTEYGDINLDGKIDNTDLTRLSTNWGPGDWGWGDGNLSRELDTVIDIVDLTRLARYGYPPLPDAVPEPASAGLLLLGAAAVLRKRREA